MEGGDKVGELFFGDVLKFVDEDDKGGLSGFGSLAYGDEEILEVRFKVTVVGESGFGFEVECDFEVFVFDFEFGETCEGSEGALGEGFGFFGSR